ncbi:hypothetical protein [Ponticaulis profundi]|uniref:Uncharacterized protein n=1 Tax=Ponticaulis profundi TaxID=2665222 RepID=A0ABW1S993_9PROT
MTTEIQERKTCTQIEPSPATQDKPVGISLRNLELVDILDDIEALRDKCIVLLRDTERTSHGEVN